MLFLSLTLLKVEISSSVGFENCSVASTEVSGRSDASGNATIVCANIHCIENSYCTESPQHNQVQCPFLFPWRRWWLHKSLFLPGVCREHPTVMLRMQNKYLLVPQQNKARTILRQTAREPSLRLPGFVPSSSWDVICLSSALSSSQEFSSIITLTFSCSEDEMNQ